MTTVLLSNKTDTLDSYDLSSIEHLSVFGNSYVSLDVQLLTNMKSLTLGNSNCTAVLSGTVPNLEELYLQRVLGYSSFSAPNLKKLRIYGMRAALSLH